MYGTNYASVVGSKNHAATIGEPRQVLAEPLWFALMCRKIFGANAAKELQFVLSKSDRTCRSWSSGDSEPPAGVLARLILSQHQRPVLGYLGTDESDAARDLAVMAAMHERYEIRLRA